MNATRVELAQKPTDLVYAGQPVPAVVTVNSSLHWGGAQEEDAEPQEEYRLQYDVSAELSGAWLVCGPKRGEFDATVSAYSLSSLEIA